MVKYTSNIKIITGNIFTSNCQTLVNTVNCVGIMGSGIALEFKFRYPEMFDKYVKLCNENKISIGSLWLYKSKDKFILNFPTKDHWKYPTKIEYLEKGLKKFNDTYAERGIISIAFPILGASNGGLSDDLSLSIMTTYLSACNLPIEIYKYDPNAYDDLYISFKDKFLSIDSKTLSKKVKLKSNFISRIKEALTDPTIKSLSRLSTVNGIGLVSLERSFKFAMKEQISTEQSFEFE